MHKNIQFQVTVKPEFMNEVLVAIQLSGLERWRYLNLVVDDILGKGAQFWATGEEVPNRKGIVVDYWKEYNRIPFILTAPGLSALAKKRDEHGYRTLSGMLRDYLTIRVCADLDLDPTMVVHPRRSEKGTGFRRAGT
jgi:hypothetical protein